jgi:hypothetical protein
MPDADDRRRKARLFRRVASIPTEGGHVADRALEVLAEQLEAEGGGAANTEGSDPITPSPAAPLRHRGGRRARS